MVEKILYLMKTNQISANKLTTELNLPNSAITEWKKGKAKPSVDALVKIANYFNVSTDYLLGITPASSFCKSNTLLYGGENTKKQEIIDILKQTDSIPDSILDLVIAALKPYK